MKRNVNPWRRTLQSNADVSTNYTCAIYWLNNARLGQMIISGQYSTRSLDLLRNCSFQISEYHSTGICENKLYSKPCNVCWKSPLYILSLSVLANCIILSTIKFLHCNAMIHINFPEITKLSISKGKWRLAIYILSTFFMINVKPISIIYKCITTLYTYAYIDKDQAIFSKV